MMASGGWVGCGAYVSGGSVAEPMCWVGGLQVHNHATSWPNLQMRICKNSSLVEFQVGPSVAIIFLGVGTTPLA